jgi:Skp family chaperone for outer membrane proteins
MRVKYFGWIVAAAVLAVGVGAGFQGQTTKLGVVDLAKVFNDSDYAKGQTDTLKAVGAVRQGMLEFADTYRTFTPEQANRFHDLSIKPNPTATEKAEIEQIKKAVMDSDARLKALQTKTSPTPAEAAELQELSRRSQTTQDSVQRWSREFNDELNQMQSKLRQEALDRVRDAVKQVGTSQGYTIIFTTDMAPYGANDVTADALKAMNAKK